MKIITGYYDVHGKLKLLRTNKDNNSPKIRFKRLNNGKILPCCDFEGKCTNFAYAEVLLGVRGRFPQRFTSGIDGKRRAKKYAHKVLDALGMSPKKFLQRHDKLKMIRKYCLDSFYRHAFDFNMLNFFKVFDKSLTSVDAPGVNISEEEIEKILKAYDQYERKATKASEALGYCEATIIKY